jgi:SAM-dependent methyltransferase
MIERFEARAREEGLSNLEGCVMDAHELELEDDSFDLVGSMFGVMLVPELGRALEEMRRVARPGGKVMVVTFGPVPQVEFLGFFTRAMKAVIPNFQGLPSDPPPLPFQVADPEKLRQAMDKAGLQDVHVARTTEALEFRSGQHLWNWVKSSNPIGARWAAGLAPEQVSAVQNKLDQMLDERAGEEDVAVLRIAVNVGIGRKDKRS